MTHRIGNDVKIPMIPGTVPEMKVSILSEIHDYNLELMNIPEVWRDTHGENVKVVVLDTGLPDHVDLDPSGGKSFINGYLQDECGHSTFVGGIISAKADNNMGVKGIAPMSRDYYGAVLDADGSGDINSIIRGIYWAVDEIGADVINMSLGIPGNYRPGDELEKACNYANSQGCTLFASAGNDALSVNWPAAYDSVIAVAAVDRKMRLAEFSSRGPEVEFAAGGVDVFSTYLNNGYATMSGTSFSCPAVAGVGCLIAAKFKARGMRLTPDEIRQRIRKISYDVGPAGRDDMYGYGIPVFTKSQEVPGTPKKQSFWQRLWNTIKIG